MDSKIKSTPQTSMSKLLEKYQKLLELQHRQNELKQAEGYNKEKNTVIY